MAFLLVEVKLAKEIAIFKIAKKYNRKTVLTNYSFVRLAQRFRHQMSYLIPFFFLSIVLIRDLIDLNIRKKLREIFRLDDYCHFLIIAHFIVESTKRSFI